MSYLVDGGAVSGFTFIAHAVRPAPTLRREEQYPGVAERIVVQAPLNAPDVSVTGYFRSSAATVAAAIAANDQLILTNKQTLTGSTHTVKIHNLTFSEMELLDIRALTEIQTVAAAGTKTVRQLVEWTWRQLTNSRAVDA